MLESIGLGILTSAVYDGLKFGKNQITTGLWGFIVETKDEFSTDHLGTDEVLEKFFFDKKIAIIVNNYRNKGTKIDFEELLTIFQEICQELNFKSEPKKTLREFFNYLDEKISSNKKIYNKIILRYSQDTNEKVGYTLNAILELKEQKTSDKKSTIHLSEKPKYFKGTSTHFMGRIKEKQDLVTYFEKNNRISIVGEGGLGKTSLAIEIIHLIEGRFGLIIPFYFTSEISYDNFLLEVAKRVGIDSDEFNKNSLDHRLEIVMNELSKRKRVLVFADNYEMIVSKIEDIMDSDATKVNHFLESLPNNTSIILTSRRKENLSNEILVNLEGLANDEGYELFCKVAKKNLANLEQDETISKIKSVIQKVGGHPLAIEILASSYKGNIEEFDLMDNSLGVGVQNPKSVEERLRSLDSCFEYSINLLSEKIKQFLFQIAILSSPFPSKLTNDVFSIKKENLDELHEHSLLQRIEKDEFGELDREFWLYDFHPVIHEFLRKKLESEGFENSFSEELALTFAEIMSEQRKYFVNEKIDQIIRSFLLMTKNEPNDLEHFSEFITNPNTKSQYLGLLGNYFHHAGLTKKSKETYEKIFQIFNLDNFPENLLPILGNYALLLSELEHYEDAIFYQKQLASIFEKNQDFLNCGVALDNIALMHYRIGNKIDAKDYCEKSINKLKNTKNKSSLANAYLNLGNILRRDDSDKSLELIENARKKFVEINDLRRIAICHNDLGMTYHHKNNLEQTQNNLSAALEIFKKIHDKKGIADTHLNFVVVFNKHNDTSNMEKHLSKCLPLFEELNDIRGVMECNFQQGNRFATDRKINEAMRSFQKAYSLAESSKNTHQLGRIGTIMGTIFAGGNYYSESFSYLSRSWDIFEHLHDEYYTDTCKIGFTILTEGLKASLNNNKINNNQKELKKDFELLIQVYSKLGQDEEVKELQVSMNN